MDSRAKDRQRKISAGNKRMVQSWPVSADTETMKNAETKNHRTLRKLQNKSELPKHIGVLCMGTDRMV
jgi:trehalose-6-phosphate synthase